MIVVEDVLADEVLDSRGNPTVRVKIKLSDGTSANAIVPSGASTGKREALELRDGDTKRYLGKGVLKACEHVNIDIAEAIVGLNPYDQSGIDRIMQDLDGTHNFSKLGANATLGVSMALARVAAKSLNMPLYRYLGGANATILPVGMFNIINGGSHADNSVDFQEYMIMPVGFDSFADGLRAASEVYAILKQVLKDKGHSTGLGDEGGFAPNLANNEEPIKVIMEAIQKAGYKAGEDMVIALDVASSEFVCESGYKLESEDKVLSSAELVAYYEMLCSKYPIVSIEDGLSEDDWEGWKLLTKKLGDKVQLVGDDLFVTNKAILADGIANKVGNAILIKPNQIGTVSQTMQTIRLAQRNGYKCVMSHRSGESEDAFIADFAVALNTGEIKTGAMARGERNAKYNRLLEIERELCEPEYLGKSLFNK